MTFTRNRQNALENEVSDHEWTSVLERTGGISVELSFVLEYFGDCRNVIDFFTSVFDDIDIEYKTFKEMPLAEALGISGKALELIWQCRVRIPFYDSILNFNLSDSVLVAMQKDIGFSKPLYQPMLCISCEEEKLPPQLLEKMSNAGKDSVDVLKGGMVNLHGIYWSYQKDNNPAIYYCLSFEGFCRDVIAFYENVFNISAVNVVTYGEASCADCVSIPGKEMIFSAILCFSAGGSTCRLMLRDSYSSAVSGVNSYDRDALLFYQGKYNPVFELKDADSILLSETFEKIKKGAKLNRPLSLDDHGALYGSLIDKYGICWNFYSREQ